MPQATTAQNAGIRVVLQIRPATYVASILSAQRREQSPGEFLDVAIAAACSNDEATPIAQLPWSPHAMDLFLQPADTVPEALRGPWKVLYAKVLEDPSLWTVPQTTVDDYEAGAHTPRGTSMRPLCAGPGRDW